MKETISLAKPDDNKQAIIKAMMILAIKRGVLSKESSDKLMFFDSINPFLLSYFNALPVRKDLSFFDMEALIENAIHDVKLGDHFIVIKHLPAFMKQLYMETYRGKVINNTPEFNSNWERHIDQLDIALGSIKKHLPSFYHELVFSNSHIFLHDNKKILNFTTKKALGLLSFSANEESNALYFIEELIHQGSHNFFNIFLHDKEKWFIADPNKISMSQLTKNKEDARTFFSTFHGLYTVSKRVDCFSVLLAKNIFTGKEKHELVGRFTDMIKRFTHGSYDKVSLKKIFTPAGVSLYLKLFNKTVDLIKEHLFLLDDFDMSFRDLDFYYSDFSKVNSYDDFNSRIESKLTF